MRPRMIATINEGEGQMVFVKPSMGQYPEWHVAEPPPPLSTSDQEEEEGTEIITPLAADETTQGFLAAPLSPVGSVSSTNAGSPAKYRRSPRGSSSRVSSVPDTTTSQEEEEVYESAVEYSHRLARQAQEFSRTKAVSGYDVDFVPKPAPRPGSSGSGTQRSSPLGSPSRLRTSSLQQQQDAVTAEKPPKPQTQEELEAAILGGIESEAVEETVPDFKVEEDDILTREYRAGLWQEHLLATIGGQKFAYVFLRCDAARTIQTDFTPSVHRRIRRWKLMAERSALTAARVEGARRPSATVLRAISDFFVDWEPVGLQNLLSSMLPVSYRAGEAVFHQGDRSTDMYIIMKGSIEIVVKTGVDHQHPKSCKKKNGIVVTNLNHGDLFGDNALLHLEPRCASAYCTTDTDLWRIPRELFIEHSSLVPAITHKRFRRLADDKRRANIRNVTPLLPEYLKRHSAFASWNIAALKDVIPRFYPALHRSDDILLAPDESDVKVFYILSGRLQLVFPGPSLLATSGLDPYLLAMEVAKDEKVRDPKYKEVRVKSFGPGSMIGIREAVFGEKTDWYAIVEGKTPVEMWVLDREGFLDTAREYPNCAVQSKEALHALQAASLPPASTTDTALAGLLADPIIRFCVPRDVLASVWVATAKPSFYSQDTTLLREGEDATRRIVVVTSGIVSNDNQRQAMARQRMAVADKRDEIPVNRLLELEGYQMAEATPASMAVFGAVEFALHEPTFRATVRCSTHCEVWTIDRHTLEEVLELDFPAVWFAINMQRKYVQQAVEEHNIPGLAGLVDPPCASVRNHQAASEKTNQDNLSNVSGLLHAPYKHLGHKK